MCLKVQPPWAMPAETAAVGKVILKEDSPYRLIGERLFDRYKEDNYADLYSAEGKPGISPVILAFVTVFQFMERLPDRQAAESLRMRMDWKYALHLPLAYEGFDYRVLSEFRDRLLVHQAEGRVFEQLVQEFRSMGLIKERGKQRTDSIAMLMKVRHLSRLELVVETLRLAVGAILKANRVWGEALIPPSWQERYGERFVLQRHTKEEWPEHDQHVGSDGEWLMARLDESLQAGLPQTPHWRGRLCLRSGARQWNAYFPLHRQPKTPSTGCVLWNGCEHQADSSLVSWNTTQELSPNLGIDLQHINWTIQRLHFGQVRVARLWPDGLILLSVFGLPTVSL